MWVKNSPRKFSVEVFSHAVKIALTAATVSFMRAAGRDHVAL